MPARMPTTELPSCPLCGEGAVINAPASEHSSIWAAHCSAFIGHLSTTAQSQHLAEQAWIGAAERIANQRSKT